MWNRWSKSMHQQRRDEKTRPVKIDRMQKNKERRTEDTEKMNKNNVTVRHQKRKR